MQSTSSTKHSQVIPLLNDGYSLHQIEAKNCLGKSIIGRIKKEISVDKENSKGGHPSKLSYCDKQSIICQITTGKLDKCCVHELWDRVVEEWNKIPPEKCHKLIESMPRRIQAVIRAKGGHTDY